MSKYKEKLVALFTTADLNLSDLVKMVKSKERYQYTSELTTLTELLSKTMELANTKNASTEREQMLEEYVAYLKHTDLATLRASAIELGQENLDKLLSDISGAKNVYYNTLAMKALKYHGEKTIAYLQNPNLLETLVEDAHTANLIPEKVRDIFASLDCNVSHSLKCRYLILHVNKKIANDHESFDMWLSLLYKHEGIHSLLDKVKVYYDQSLRASPRVQASMEQLTYLEEKDISDLVSTISECDNNITLSWKKVAIFLDLPHELINSIQSTNNNEADCLRLVLHAWVTRKYDCAKPPTLKNLENTLSKLGLDIYRKIGLKGMLKKEERGTLSILDQSHSIKIHESNSVLLGVVVSSVSEASLTYQWYKDGEELNDAEQAHNCYGSEDCIMNIFADNLIVEGSYTCRIQQGDHVITSEPIVLTIETPLDKYTKKLTDIYTAKPEVPEDTWPPVNIDTYINLALIKQQGINNAGEYARCTIRGDADDVFKDKESIEYESIFDGLGSGTRLLIEGRPGSGKTTLVHKISQDWANDGLKFRQVRLLFLVHLRGFLSAPNIKLHNILECYYNSETDSAFKDILKYADKHNGLGLCFILDGLDEYLPKKKDPFIHKLIKRSELPKAVVIVASRPAAVANFRPIASRQIEVLGFLKEQISEYIKAYNFSDVLQCSKLLKYLDHHPNVHHMCYLPIHAAMVCFLCQVDRSLPETESGIYKEFTIYFFLRALRQLNDDEDIYIDSIESLPSSERESYMKICKLAFEMTVSSKQVMKQIDVQDFFDVHSNRDYLGLITVDRVALKYGFQKLYTFLHLTFQEFLTAYHISKLEEEEQTKLVNEYGNAKQMQIAWKFYCGLVKFDDSSKFRSLVNNTQTGTLYKVQCSFESQQPNTCNSVVEDGSLSFKDKFLTPSDFTAIAFVISHAAQGTLNRLVFDGCTLGPEGIEVLVMKAGEKLSLVTSLCFHGHNCAAEQLMMVNRLIHMLPSLEILDITNTQLGEEAVSALTGGSKHSNLHPNLQVLKIGAIDENDLIKLIRDFRSQCSKIINIWFPDYSKKYLSSLLSLPFYFCSTGNLSDVNMSFCNLRLVEVKILSDDLIKNSVFNRLSLINCGITDEGAKVLSGGIRYSNIKIFELDLNHIDDEGALALANSIESCLSLRTLNLSCNNIGNDGAMAIVKAIASKHDFKLHLWNNNITKHGADALFQIKEDIYINSLNIDNRNMGSSGARALALALNNCSKLTSLNLSKNSIGFRGARSLADVLKHCSALGELDISDNNICVGIKALAGALKYCIDLHTLNIAHNSLFKDGAMALADIIDKYCKNLHILYISHNNIGDEGATALAGAIKQCVKLQTLDVAHNHIGRIGTRALIYATRNCTDLHTLKFSDCRTDVENVKAFFATTVRCYSRLSTLYLDHCRLNNSDVQILANALEICRFMINLDISFNHIGNEGVRVLARALKVHDLYSLDISGNDIGNDGAQALALAVKKWSNLHTLDISHNKIGSDGAIAFADAIEHCNNLRRLELSHNDIGHDGIVTIYCAIEHCSNLHSLGIRHIIPKPHPHAAHSFYHHHQSSSLQISRIDLLHVANSKLCKLDIAQNDIGRNGMKVLAGAIEHCSNLHTLMLGNNRINPEGVEALAGAMRWCSNLCTLDVGHNNLGDKGAMVLANGLEHCSCLHTLVLSGNKISEDGIQALAGAIKCHRKLHLLDISSNRIGSGYHARDEYYFSSGDEDYFYFGDEDRFYSGYDYLGDDNWIAPQAGRIVALADAIKCCSNLHTLIINNNNLSGSDINIVAEALTRCSNLHVLDISNNYIGDDGARGLTDIMKCRKMQSLNISYIQIEKEGAGAIADSIKYCHDLKTLKFYGIKSIVAKKLLKKALQQHNDASKI